MTVDEALRLREGRRLVFTNGVFDILHAGHARYLTEAAKHGDLLIVGLNSDASARALGKGEGRPINCLEDRAAVLAALRSVNGVLAFEEPTPETLIATLRPEVHVKGGDYREEDLPEAPIVRGYGGEILILPFLEGRSTTAILGKMRNE